ncbi:MAG: caspase family protein [Leptospirales bacterium]|nr:caspase family protein [Leptospirales bacterium]
MRKSSSLLVAFFALCLTSALNAQTLHFLIVADTADQSIGSSVLADLENMQNKAREIAQNAGMRLNLKVVKSPEFNYNSTLAAVQAVNPASNDTVFFYYSGHGYRTRETKTQWPNLYTKSPQPGLEFSKVLQILEAKNPRLIIALGDLCNSFSDQSTRSTNSRAFAEIQPQNYKKLFAQFAGRVYASGSKPGQYSFAMDDGGAFTNQFLQALASEVRADEPSWKRLMAVATKSIYIGSAEQRTQDPIFELREGASTVANVTQNPTTQPAEEQQEIQEVVQEDKEEEEEYQEEEMCSDLSKLVGAMKNLDGALKPDLRMQRGDKLYQALENFNTAMKGVAEGYGDRQLTREVRRLDRALAQTNLGSYKQSLKNLIDYFSGVAKQQGCRF